MSYSMYDAYEFVEKLYRSFLVLRKKRVSIIKFHEIPKTPADSRACS